MPLLPTEGLGPGYPINRDAMPVSRTPPTCLWFRITTGDSDPQRSRNKHNCKDDLEKTDITQHRMCLEFYLVLVLLDFTYFKVAPG